jgi:hypothetical protein
MSYAVIDSPDFTAVSLRPLPIPELFVRIVSGCWWIIGALGEEVVDRRGARVSGVNVVELVPGRETGDDTLRGCN